MSVERKLLSNQHKFLVLQCADAFNETNTPVLLFG
jgi:hypothetical protein